MAPSLEAVSMRYPARRLLSLALLLGLVPPAAAQIRLYTLGAVGSAPEFARVGDLNGDGYDDLAYTVAPGVSGFGLVRVVSGADGETNLLLLSGEASDVGFGHSLAGPGDLSGDGVPDLLVSAPSAGVAGADAGFVRAVSGSDGSTLFTVHGLAAGERLGHDIAGVGDVDGDDVPDFLASAGSFSSSLPAAIDDGRVRLYSGAGGSVLHEWIGPTSTERFGITVSAAGDVDADGQGDLMIGALDSFLLRVYSGADFSLLHALLATPWDITPAGDLDGDGHDDVGTLVGWPNDGWLRVYSGATGLVIREFAQGGSTSLGDAIAAPGDLDADGSPDYLVGETGVFSDVPGRVRLFSGATGSALYTIFEQAIPAQSDNNFGFKVDVLGDVDGNGLLDFGSSSPSQVHVIAGNKSALAAFAQGPVEGATPATLTATGTLLADQELTLVAAPLPPAAPSLLVVGFAQLDATFKGGTMVPSVDVLIGPMPASGAGTLTLTGRWPAGLPHFFSAWFQVWALDGGSPTGFRATNGVVATQL